MRRIAFIVGDLGFGGASTLLLGLAGKLLTRGVAAQFFTLEKHCAFESDLVALGIPRTSQDENRDIFEDRIRGTLKALAEFQPTVVVAWLGPGSLEVLRYLPGGVYRMAVVHCDHEMFYNAARPYHAVLDEVVGVSHKIGRVLRNLPEFSGLRISSIPNGVSVPAMAPFRDLDKGQPLRILYFGRVQHPQKRVRLFPEILRVLVNAGIPLKWTIAGDGTDRQWLEENMRTPSGLQSVCFLDAIPHHEVPHLLDQHDIFLLVSDAEGTPMSLLEAMGHGLVPVVSDLESGVREAVDDTNGILVPVNDIEGYARGIIHLHEHRDELMMKSSAARERVLAEFSVERMTERWLAVFPSSPSTPWPSRWKILPPMKTGKNWRFTPLGRILRRVAARLRWQFFGSRL